MTFTIAICFMSGESKEDYDFPIQQLQALSINLRVFLTDCDGGLMNSVDDWYPFTPSFLCRWHVNKNIFSYCIKSLGGEEEGQTQKDFNTAQHTMLNAPTKDGFNKAVDSFCEKYDKEETAKCVSYIKKTWLIEDRKT